MNKKLQMFKNPYALLFLGLGIFIIFFILAALSTRPEQETKKGQEPTGRPEAVRTSDRSGIVNENFPKEDYYGDYDPSGLKDVQKTEDLPNGTKLYVASSSNPTRPNIIIAKDNKTIYQRSIPERNADIPLENVFKLQGQPERIINGPDFYGVGVTNEYIYAKKGIAVVVNTQTRQVVEHHFFQPTTVDDYIEKYGNDQFQ